MAHIKLTSNAIENFTTARLQEEFYDEGFPGPGSFGVRVNRGGRKSFFLIYALGGKRRRMTLGAFPVTSLEGAREQALSILRLVEAGRDPAAETASYAVIFNFRDLVGRFMSEHVSAKCKASTAREYRRIIERELVPPWGNIAVSEIRPELVYQLIREIRLTRGSPVMAARVRAVASKIFEFAISERLIEENPVSGIVPPNGAEQPVRILSVNEIRSLWLKLGTIDEHVAGIFKLILLTGQLPSLVSAMRWEDIRLDWWYPHGSRSDHEVYLNREALTVLKSLGTGKGAFVFPASGGGHLKHIRKSAKRLSEGATGGPWSPRDLRRTLEVNLRLLGIRPDVVEKILNRKTSFGAVSRRLGLTDYDYSGEVKRAMVLVGRRIAEIVSNAPPPKPGAKVIPLFPV